MQACVSPLQSIFPALNIVDVKYQWNLSSHILTFNTIVCDFLQIYLFMVNLTTLSVAYITQLCTIRWYSPEDGGSVFLRNVGNHLQDHTASQSTRPSLVFWYWNLQTVEEAVICICNGEEYRRALCECGV
jgi:hypothetical protein